MLRSAPHGLAADAPGEPRRWPREPTLLAVYPNFIAHTALTSSEGLFTAALLLAVFAQLEALDRASPSVTALAGLAFGVAALIKPQAAPVPVLIWALGRAWMPVPCPRRLVMLGILCVAMAVPLSAWTVRNYRVFGTVFFVWDPRVSSTWTGRCCGSRWTS